MPVVKQEKRYFFDKPNSDKDDSLEDSEIISPAGVLERIVKYAQHADLFRILSPEVRLFRARKNDSGLKWRKPEDLGPPPNNKAKQNRMSPAGIAMLYVSNDPHTARAETSTREENSTVARFRLKRSVMILDLTEIPSIPSLFEDIPDAVEFNAREILPLLHNVRMEISRPIQQDNRVHVEYVPTQVVTEYLKYYPRIHGKAIEGIKYPSSVSPGNWSVVFFADRRNVVGIEEENSIFFKREKWIELECII